MLMSDSPLPSEPSPALAQAVSIWLPRSAPIPLVEQAVRRLAGRDDAMVSHSPMPEPSAVLAPPPPASLRSNEAELLNLSQRQYEVLLLLSYGHPLKKVASLLQISVATVKSHTRTVYQALGVHSKSEAIYAARQAGAMLCWGCARDSQPRWQAGYDAWSDEASGEEPRIVSDPEEEESRLPLVWQRTAMA
jgi:DNA-binding NarL/FixJ family response regulator